MSASVCSITRPIKYAQIKYNIYYIDRLERYKAHPQIEFIWVRKKNERNNRD